MIVRNAALAFLTIMAGQAAFAATLPDQIDAVVTSYFASNPVGGFSVGVTWHGETLLTKGYGFAEVATSHVADEHTVFAIGSMTKQFTAAAILQLVDQGALDLDQDVHDAVPDFPRHAQRITLRQLLNHTSGVPDYMPTTDADSALVFKPITQAAMLARFAAAPLDFDPGSNFAYSNSNFYLLGLAIEHASGETYAHYLRQHFFRPLGMDHTFICGAADAPVVESSGYVVDGTGKLVASPDVDMTWAFSAGEICSSAGDILAWDKALHRGNLLPDWAYSVMTTAAVLTDGTATTYGTAQFVDQVAGHRHIEHGGDTLTFSSQNAYYPDDDLAIVVLTNTQGSTFDRFALERAIGRVVLGIAAPVVPTAPVPADLSSKLTGDYDVVGRLIFGPNPTLLALTGSQLVLSNSAATAAFTYQGDGVFDFSPLSLHFPLADGSEPYFQVYVYEMMLGRGMRLPTGAVGTGGAYLDAASSFAMRSALNTLGTSFLRISR